MKKIYLNTLYILWVLLVSPFMVKTQTCTTPSPPSITGNTLAACVSSGVFTLTANGTPTNYFGWFNAPWGGNAISTNTVFVSPTLTTGATYYAGQFVGLSTSSISLPSYVSGYSGNTRGMWFTAPITFVITGLRVPTDVGGTSNSAIAVMKFPTTPPAYSTVTNSFNILYMDQNIVGTGIVPVNIPVYAGDVIGILGARAGVTSYGPINPVAATIGTTALTLTRLGMQYNLASQTPLDLWQESGGSLGRIEVYTAIGCMSTLTPVTVTVLPAPQIFVAGPTSSICANSSFTLNASGVNTYTWAGGQQTSSLVITPSVTTTYSVSGSINPGCSSLTAITVSVNPGLPVLTAQRSNSVVCSGNTVSLNGLGATTYTWFGAVNTITNNVAFVPLATTAYTLAGTNACGTTSVITSVTVNPTPTLITTASPSVICNGDVATISVSGAATYTWTSTNVVASSMTVNPSSATLYNVNGMSSLGCPASAAQVLLVNPSPTITAVTNKPYVCAGGSATLNSTGADNYSWNTGALTPTAVVNPQVTTVYTVTGSYATTGCSVTNVVTVNVFIPSIFISASSTVCSGAAITLTASATPGSTYLWNTGNPFPSTPVTATQTALYTVSVTSSSNGVTCMSSKTVMVNVNPNPTVTAVSSRTSICKGEKTIINAGGASTYSWNSVSATTASIQVSPSILTTYMVTGTDANGCSADASIQIKVNACTGISEQAVQAHALLVYPNPSNGGFSISAEFEISLQISNELGEVIKELKLSETNAYRENIKGLSEGIYFISGQKADQKVYHKIVVTH